MSTKLKKCPNCSQLFSLKSLSTIQNNDCIPLFLKCGHSICEKCVKNLVKFSEPIECKICHNDMEIPESDLVLIRNNTLKLHQLFPVNIYMLGELSLDLLEPKCEQKKEDYDCFINLNAIIQSAETSQGQCLECNTQTIKMCQQCCIVLCESCFNKSHKNFIIFKNHKLQNIEPQLTLNKCKEHSQKTLDYYCKDCSKSICMDCLVVGAEKLCKDHNLVSTQEVNEEILEELAQISPKVEETYKRLTKTAVDVGYLLHSIINETETTDLTKVANEVEQHFSQLTCLIQKEKQKVCNLILEEKKAEKESLDNVKIILADSIKKATSVLIAVKKSLSAEKIKQANLAVLLEDAKNVIDSPWYLSPNKSSIKVTVDEELTNVIIDFIRIERDSIGEYKILATADLDPCVEIPPPPVAPVYPPELPKDIRKQKQAKPTIEKEDEKTNSFYKTVPKYRSKSGSVSSLNSLNSESSNKSSVYSKDDYYCKPVVQAVSPFVESQQPKQLYAGSQELIYVSHIISPHNFFVQRACHQGMVEELLKEFRNAVSYPTPSISHIAEGKFYLVFNKTDKLWQRGRIISVDRKEIEKPIVHVFCIDFGSTVVVTIDKLRLIPPARVQSPLPFAISCSLSNCKPVSGTWTSDDSFLIQNITNNKQAVLHIHRIHSTPNCGVSVECDVTTFEYGVSLAHALVFHGRALLINPKAPYPKNTTVIEKPKLFISNNDFKLKTVEEVYLTHIVSPDNFYVRKRHLQNVYEKLCEELDQNYTLSVNTGTIYLPKMGMVCVINLEKYDVPDANTSETRALWARAIVKELPGRGRVRVQLPDCGATVLTHWSALRHIHPKFTTLRALATECHLAGVTPLKKKWSPNSVALLQTFRDRLLELYVEENRNYSLGVTLHDKTDTEKVRCINDEMVNYKFAISFGMFKLNKDIVLDDQVITNKLLLHQEKPPKPTSNVTILKRKVNVPGEKYNQLEAKDKGPLRLEAKILNYQSPSLIYVSFVHQQKTLNDAFDNIQKYYSKKKTDTKINWNVGDKCCTICHQSQTWRRAAIVEINGENAKVFYSDFACIETVSLASLNELTPEFSKIGYAAVKCHLCGVMPADGEEWPSLTKEYLKDMLDVYKRIFITKVGDFKENSMPVEMWVYHTTQGSALEPNTSEWRCLNKKIIEQGLGIPDKSIQISTTCNENNNTNENTLSFLNVTGSIEEWLQLEPLPTMPLVLESDSVIHSTSSTPVEFELTSKNDDKTNTVFISDWMPPELPQSQEFIGVPTYVDNDGMIYLHDISQQDTLHLIRKALDVRFKNPDPKAKYAKWVVGEPCLALYYLDNKFYRGRIMEVNNEASTCLVHYIDYGNEENCTFTNLRKSVALYQIPTQAIKCKLSRIQPVAKYWDRQTLDYLHKSIVEKQCFVEIIGESIEGIHPIKLKFDKLWIDDHLVDFEMAKYSDGSKAVIRKFAPANIKGDIIEHSTIVELDSGPDYIVADDDDEDVALSLNSHKSNSLEGKDWNKILQEEEEEKQSVEEKILTFKNIDDSYFICNITVINDFNLLELNIVYNEEIIEQYEKMFQKIQEAAKYMTPLNGIFENKACVAIFNEDGQWYRACILEYSENTCRIKVRYVDYGNIEIISLADVKEIDEEFTKLPPLSIQATLNGVRVNPDIDISTVTNEFRDTFLDKGPFYVQVIDTNNGVPSVDLKNKSCELVYDHLIKSHILLCSDIN